MPTPISFDPQFLDQLKEGVYLVDTDRSIIYWNQEAERITGFSKQEVLGRCCKDNILIHVDENGTLLCREGCPLHYAIADGKQREAKMFLCHKNGHRLPVLIKSIPVRNSENQITGAFELFTDQSTLQTDSAKMQSLAQMAFTDRLTGLTNRNYLDIKLDALRIEMQRTNNPLGIVLTKTHGFHDVLERLGEEASGRLIKIVSKTITALVPSNATVGRWTETEFLVLIPNAQYQVLSLTALKMKKVTEKSQIEIDKKILTPLLTVAPLLSETNNDLQAIQNAIRDMQKRCQSTAGHLFDIAVMKE